MVDFVPHAARPVKRKNSRLNHSLSGSFMDYFPFSPLLIGSAQLNISEIFRHRCAVRICQGAALVSRRHERLGYGRFLSASLASSDLERTDPRDAPPRRFPARASCPSRPRRSRRSRDAARTPIRPSRSPATPRRGIAVPSAPSASPPTRPRTRGWPRPCSSPPIRPSPAAPRGNWSSKRRASGFRPRARSSSRRA